MQRTDISASPYYDDYEADKNFHRILFRPRPVQARELNQVQSILMDQISRLGNHLFTEGSMVIPGGIKVIKDQNYVMFNFVGQSTLVDVQDRDNLTLKSSVTGLTAKISKIIPQEGSERPTMFVDYVNSGSAQEKLFSGTETLVVYETVDNIEQPIATISVIGVGTGTWAKVVSGVWFVRGMFVKAPDQDVIVQKYSAFASARIGFKIVESIIDETDDESLLSNANGLPNFKAPGANRLKIDLILSSIELNANDSDFIELARVEGGAITSKIESTDYSVIQKALAQRTYETNGDYTVDAFGIEVKEHLLANNNGGVYKAEDGGDSGYLVACIKPGIGYVKGYRVQNQSIMKVPFEKARETQYINNSVTTADYGPYILIKNMKSLPKIDVTKKVNILNGTFTNIGYCRIRSIRKETDSTYRLYIFDVNMSGNYGFSEAVSLKYSDVDSLFTADLVNPLMYGASKNSLLFKLPVDAVKTLLNNGASDTSYTVMRSFKATTNASGVATIGVGASESFASIDNTNYFVSVSGAANDGTLFVSTDTITLSGNPAGSSITVVLGAGQANKPITVIAPVVKLVSTQKTKSIVTVVNEAISFANVSQMNLTKADIKEIVSITDATTNADITDLFLLDNGQRSNWYQVGAIVNASGAKITRSVKVTYRYYEHSVGDYFSVDSYGAMNRAEIGVYSGLALADCFDFRPKKDSAGDITGVSFNGELVRPNDTIRADITYYLPRADAVYVSSNGTFGIAKGVSGAKPTVPDIPLDAMKLFELYLPAFTSSTNDVLIAFMDNKRYTMRDIGKLEKRIENVEYYTTLSALETKANATQIFDPVTGNSRFKNGFAVDGFIDFRLADTRSINWAASIDSTAGELKPTFVENGSDYKSTSMTAAVKSSNVYMKSYTETPAVTQPYATKTININPYAVFTWVGLVTMNPSNDFWKDVVYMAPVVINNVYDNRGSAQAGTVWSYWTGFYGIDSYENQGRQNIDSSSTGNLTVKTTTGYMDQEQVATTTSFWETNNTNSYTSTLGSTIIPFMRSIDITVSCQKFRPFTRLYVFWDDVDVNADCKPIGGIYGAPLVSDVNGAITFIYTVPNRANKSFRTGTSSIRVVDSATNDVSSDGWTTIGEATFKSGGSTESRQDTVINTTVLGSTTTRVENWSTSVIRVQTEDIWDDVQQIFVPTPVPQPTPVAQPQSAPAPDVGGNTTAPVVNTNTSDTGSGFVEELTDWDDRWHMWREPRAVDPIAQTFRVPVAGGCFITKFDVFFATKSKTIPVMLELRTVSTGLPTSNVFARKILNPNQVNVSADSSVATSFVFDDPIFVEENVEYAAILMADTQEYTVYISELGENLIGQQASLAKQPNLGVFLTSSNSTTWTPNQLQDLKFTIHRAVFNTNVDGSIVFNGADPIALPVAPNAVSTITGSNLLTIRMQSHGLKAGDNVVVTGFVSGNGIVDTTINGVTKAVVSVTLDTFTITASVNATTTGTVGGTAMKVKANYPFALFMANIDTVSFNRTGITWEFRYIEQGSRSYTTWYEFTPKTTFSLPREGVMRSGADFQIRATIKSANPSLSPVISTQSFTNIMVSPRVNNDFVNPVYVYETSTIQFDNPSTSATFYVGAKLPAGSNMKLYYKAQVSADDDLSNKVWTEIVPKNPITNDSSRFIEYTYQLGNVPSFVGYKVKIVLISNDPVNYPTLTDFRSIALA